MLKIIEKYIPKMFGGDISSDDGQKYIDRYKHEWKSSVLEYKSFKRLELSVEQLEGCLMYSLCGILIDEDLNRFVNDGFKEFAAEIYNMEVL